MRHLVRTCLTLALLSASLPAQAAEKIKVLIVDGQNNHDWKLMTPPMQHWLEETGRFTVDVATTPQASAQKAEWASFLPRFREYDVVLSNYNGELWPEAVRRDFEAFVADGGGVVILHAANNAFPDWKEYNQMIGLGWRQNSFGDRLTVTEDGSLTRTPAGEGPGAGHGRRHAFQVTVDDTDHPVVKGMPARWMHAKDELYHGQRGPAENLNLIASAYSDPDTGGTGSREPMMWWIPYGKGKVFTNVMGHVGRGDEEMPAIRCVGFITVMQRACEWVATGKVTIPVPEAFPTEKETRLTEK